MRVTPTHSDNFYEYNKYYNEKLSSIADDTVFVTNEFVEINYIPIGKIMKRKTDVVLFDPENANQPNLLKNEFEDIYDMEELIISCMTNGNYPTYFMAGGMGCGKSSTAKYVIEQIEKRYKDTDIFIEHFTFNLNSDANEPSATVVKRFNESFFDKLIVSFSDYLYKRPSFVEDFIIEMQNNTDKYSSYSRIITSSRNDSWKELGTNKKREEIVDFLHEKAERDTALAIRSLMLFLNYVYDRTKGKDLIIMLIDNIDTVSIEAQIDLCVEIAKYNDKRSIKCLIPVRRATLKRYQNHESKGSKQALHYNLIYFRSHDPVVILRKRIQYWIENGKDHDTIKNLNSEQSEAFLKRLRYLSKNLTDKDNANYFSKSFSSLTGRSIRMAISLALRTVVNSCCEYNDDFENHSQATNSLFYPSNNIIMLPGDKYVVNIFRNGLKDDDKFSLITLRILTYIINFAGNRKYDNVGTLLHYVRNFKDENGGDKWTDEEIDAAFEKLLNDNRPLLYTDYIYGIKKLEGLKLDPSVRIFPTEIGNGYYKHLIHDYKYLLNAFLPLNFDDSGYKSQWKLDSTVDMRKISEKLFLLTKQLNHFFERDVASLQVNDEWVNLKISPKFISIEVICSVIKNLLSVMEPKNTTGHLYMHPNDRRQFFELYSDLLRNIISNEYLQKSISKKDLLQPVVDLHTEIQNAKGLVY